MKKLIGLLLLVCSFSFSTLQAQEQEKAEAEPEQTQALLIGLFAGYHGSWIEGFKDVYGKKGGLSLGAEMSVRINDQLRGVLRYNYFSATADNIPDWNQNIVNLGLNFSGFGGGVSYTSIEGTSGTGFYAELTSIQKGAYFGLKFDFVNIEKAKAGGVCVYLGYALGP